ncbi:hypothetical protein E6P09_05205 [Haloferax mediterranei ATCC 33500]|uniref:Uncharacterized protein n=1 Tax=Haloferax mediterranei (strain ATCC 33500 / DSM 1411 / JCM 8866 / NBRC 14739 / NCIMB 2177 / R-4) TaxID=523841 RepID=I3R1Q2_HALMT|nr:hypothetical protein [Haloferax mediterranei]AFK18162.1 hypothetical protein HFX_0427 [Haloferax mediterranei ATCC 33500]AHZ22430.1 hypothetical protein BM92_07120 [Haloferax mediterranei ATCC 33500]EMA02564.1 hypothetical protein C439_08275 [Haloferax mediterranei ATCC 33500]MDX5988253.1 hypothetical protein [Haloferax mediterranei ATCC 33500]QCQ74693.1 hypothetical protein E6P09_05205 [Haloferax mediterranei ATCC 33500]
MVTLPSTEPTLESFTNPLTLLGLFLVALSVVVAGVALREGDVVTALGMGLLLTSGVFTTGIGLSGKSI